MWITRLLAGSLLPAPTTAQSASSPTMPGTAGRCTTQSACSGAYAFVLIGHKVGRCSLLLVPRHVQRLLRPVQRRRPLRVQRQRGHEPAHLEGECVTAAGNGATRAPAEDQCCAASDTTDGPRLQSLPREKKKAAFDAALVSRYAHLPEVKRIARCGSDRSAPFAWRRTHHAVLLRQRHVPKAIHKASQLRHTMEESQRVKRDNVAKHSAPGSITTRPARKERIVAELH
jgi:hypothetical protein